MIMKETEQSRPRESGGGHWTLFIFMMTIHGDGGNEVQSGNVASAAPSAQKRGRSHSTSPVSQSGSIQNMVAHYSTPRNVPMIRYSKEAPVLYN